MKITIILPLRFRLSFEKTKYLPGENEFDSYCDGKFVFPISHIIGNYISNDSEVEVILIETTSDKRNTAEFVQEAKEEISGQIFPYTQNIIFKRIKAPYTYSVKTLGNIYKEICSSISKESMILIDMTYGPKYMPLVLFCVLNYAEKYLDCEISKLYYGLFDNKKGELGRIVDFTPLYLLNTFGAIFDGSKESFDSFADNLLK